MGCSANETVRWQEFAVSTENPARRVARLIVLAAGMASTLAAPAGLSAAPSAASVDKPPQFVPHSSSVIKPEQLAPQAATAVEYATFVE
jgi:hypothetical protein